MCTIYVAEDSELDQYIIGLTITKYHPGTKVVFFKNGLLLLNDLKSNSMNIMYLPDIILLDINMPMMDGWDFLARFDGITNLFAKPISVYILTVLINPADIKKSKGYGFVKDFFSKPLLIENLAGIIEHGLLISK